MADAPTPAPAAEEDEEQTVIRLPKGKNRLDSDEEVFAAKKAAAIAVENLKQKKAEDELKKLGKPKSKTKEKLDHYKEETELHEAKHKYEEFHPPLPWKWIFLGLMILGIILVFVVGMNHPHPSPGLALAQYQAKRAAGIAVVWGCGLGFIAFFVYLLVSSAKNQKKLGGGGKAHHN